LQDDAKHVVRARQGVIVPEAQDAVAGALQAAGTARITVPASMLAAVELDHQPPLDTGEVRNVWADGVLPAELCGAQPAVAKEEPEPTLGIGHLAAQAPGESVLVSFAHETTSGWGTSLQWLAQGRCRKKPRPHPGPLPQAGEGERHTTGPHVDFLLPPAAHAVSRAVGTCRWRKSRALTPALFRKQERENSPRPHPVRLPQAGK
jgi:hypothetical protein